MTGHLKLVQSIHEKARREAKRHQTVERGTVTSLSPLTVKMWHYDPPLIHNEDFDLSQWMTFYHAIVGISAEDTVLMHRAHDWVMHDVISDKDVVGILNAWDLSRGPS